MAHVAFGVGDAKEADTATAVEALPIETRGRAPAVVADIEKVEIGTAVGIGGRLFVGGTEADAVETGDIDSPDAVTGRQVIEGFGIEVVVYGDTADADVLCEGINEAALGGHDPGAFIFPDGAFEDATGAGGAHGETPGEGFAAAFALRGCRTLEVRLTKGAG